MRRKTRWMRTLSGEKQFEFDKHYQGTHKSSKPRQTMGRAGCSWIWPSWNIVAFLIAIQLIISVVSSWAKTFTEFNTYILMCKTTWKVYGFWISREVKQPNHETPGICLQFSSLQMYLPIKKQITVSRGCKNSVSPKTCQIYGPIFWFPQWNILSVHPFNSIWHWIYFIYCEDKKLIEKVLLWMNANLQPLNVTSSEEIKGGMSLCNSA